MSTVELIAYGTLWIMLISLAALVLVLYRQVEKAYAAGSGQGGIRAGSEAPDLEVLGPSDVTYYRFDDAAEVLAAFVSTSCDSCVRLLKTLNQHFRDENLAVFTSGSWTDEFRGVVDGLPAYDLAHPFDAERLYGLTTYPTLYLVVDRRIVGRTSDVSRAAIARLLDGDRLNESEPRIESGAADYESSPSRPSATRG